MSLHVVHVVSSFDTGGLQNGIVNLANGSDPRRLRHTVLSFSPRIGMKERLRSGDVRSLSFGGGRELLAFRHIRRALKELRPDVVHTRNWGVWPDGTIAAVAAGVTARVHGYHGRDLANASGELGRRRLLGRLLARFDARIVALTEAMKREFRRDFGVSDEKIRVIPNGIDLDRIDATSEPIGLAGDFTVCTAGRLDPVKNVDLLIEAFLAMGNREAGDRLLIAGDGPERSRLEALASRLGAGAAIVFLGERRDVPAVMREADVYVQASFYEGMSNTVVEAMACGVAVIATDVGGNPDVVGRDGAGILVPSEDRCALRAALERLKDRPEERARIAAAGRARARGAFSLEAMIAAYTALYEDVAVTRAPGPRESTR